MIRYAVMVVLAVVLLAACNNSELNLFRIRVLVEDCAQVPDIQEAATAVAEAEHDGPGELVGGIQDVADVACTPAGRVPYGYRVEATGGPLATDPAWNDVSATFCDDRFTLYVDEFLSRESPVLAALGPAIAAQMPSTACMR